MIKYGKKAKLFQDRWTEWTPVFSDDELDLVRSIESRPARKKLVKELRKKYREEFINEGGYNENN